MLKFKFPTTNFNIFNPKFLLNFTTFQSFLFQHKFASHLVIKPSMPKTNAKMKSQWKFSGFQSFSTRDLFSLNYYFSLQWNFRTQNQWKVQKSAFVNWQCWRVWQMTQIRDFFKLASFFFGKRMNLKTWRNEIRRDVHSKRFFFSLKIIFPRFIDKLFAFVFVKVAQKNVIIERVAACWL